MRRLRCAGLLLMLGLLLAALCPAVVVATARREMLVEASSDEDVIGRRKEKVEVVVSHRRFRTRKIPASQVPYGGRIPFTADYHSVHRHPPTHN
ncbi:unnamed protein product [Urochloa humidicola]